LAVRRNYRKRARFHTSADGAAFGFEHVGDVAGGAAAKELAESLFVVGDAMFLDEGEEVRGGVAGEGGVVRQIVVLYIKRISSCLAEALRFGIAG